MLQLIIGWVVTLAIILVVKYSQDKTQKTAIIVEGAVGIVLSILAGYLVKSINITGWINFAIGIAGGAVVHLLLYPFIKKLGK